MSLLEQAVALSDPEHGLNGYLVIHDTTRGPATGGIRLFDYPSDEDVPDYLVNAGALIQGVRFLLEGERRSPEAIAAIGARTESLLARAASEGTPPFRLLARELDAEFDLDAE